jgi:hypothetical protein
MRNASIPSEMTSLPQWIVWRYQTRKGKPSKIPYQSRNPKQEARTDDPTTWSSYAEAVEALSNPLHKLDGIGFVFTPNDGLAGIDLDYCLDDDGKVQPWARPYLDRLIGYVEVSPSGRGVKVFCRGSVPDGKGRKRAGLGTDGKGAVEIYERGRYFAVTGEVFEGRSDIGDGADQLASLHAELFPSEKKPTGKTRVATEPLDQSDASIIEKIRQSKKDGARFSALFGGSTEGYSSASNADLALCNILAFWFRGDIDAIDRIFRQSGLCREKWTERADYREMTIGKAMEGRTEFYDPNYRSKSKRTTTKKTTTEEGKADGPGEPNGEGATATETLPFTDLGSRFQFGQQPSRNGQAHTGRDDNGDRVISITTAEYLVIDQAVDALSDAPNIYQRGNMLTTIIRDDAPRNRNIIRPPGSPRITVLPNPSLRELLTRYARWEKTRKTRDRDEESFPAHPPDWAVSGVAARGSWPEIRAIEAVTETPVLRLDGTILDLPGYDERTALLFEPNAPFPPILASPKLVDARVAADVVMELVSDFPFASDHHKVAWLAALLTPLARFAIAGPCPLFLIDANTPGTGKSKLTDIIAIIATGRDMPRTAYPDNDDEMRKRISSIALAGDRMMLLDNIATTFGGSSLDSALTAQTWRDRILGRSEMTAELPLFTVWYATGNNVGLRGDVLRRIVPCRLETREERPEDRREFTIKGDLLEHVRHERPRLVAALLTILRAHAVAGWPDGGLTPLGSFEAWSRKVRSAVFWATGLDPCQTREELRATDPEVLARTALIEGWLDLPQGRTGLTVATALKYVKEDSMLYETLRGVFMEWSKTDELPSARSIGMKLKALKGRVINGAVFRSREERGTQIWRVEIVPKPE